MISRSTPVFTGFVLVDCFSGNHSRLGHVLQRRLLACKLDALPYSTESIKALKEFLISRARAIS